MIKSFKGSNYRFLRFVFKPVNSIYHSYKFVFIASYRSQIISWLRYRKYFHQVSHYTEMDRYPDLFRICRDYFAHKNNSDLKLLSFGCSTGLEVISLNNYLPGSEIIGVDISKWCLRKCEEIKIEGNIHFYHSLDERYQEISGFDAIFCLAVLQIPENRHNGNNSFSKNYLFSQFEIQIIALDSKLKPGGLLFIENSDFNFLDTSISSNYVTLNVEGNIIRQDRPLFDKNNRKVSDVTFIPRVFMKENKL